MIYASAWQPWMSDALQAADVAVTWATVGDDGSDVELRIPVPAGPARVRFHVKKWDTVRPSKVDRLPQLYRGDAPLLVVADRMTEETVERLRRDGYSWVSRRPLPSGLRGELRASGKVLPLVDLPDPVDALRAPGRGRPPVAAGRLAQALFYRGAATQRGLADETGVSQARISQLLSNWPVDSGVVRTGGRPACWKVVDPDRLLSAWLTLYVPMDRITSYWYGLDDLQEQARTAVAALGDRGRVSGGLAADLLAPWALPRRVVIYTHEGHDLSDAGFVPSQQESATLELVSTRDPAVFPSSRAESFLAAAAPVTTLPLADPLVVLSDLIRSDDLDADQAAQQLRGKLLAVWRKIRDHE